MILDTPDICDTPRDQKRGETCERCWNETQSSESEQHLITCRQCGVFHLRKNMSEKLHGHLCISCAEDYERDLLATLGGSPT
jgi:hypothetical protein